MNRTVWDRIVSHFSLLYRDRENGLLLGVCAGLAAVYRLNPLGVRVIAVVLLLCFPLPTAVVYVVLGLTLRDAPLTYFGSGQERSFWHRDRDDYGVGR